MNAQSIHLPVLLLAASWCLPAQAGGPPARSARDAVALFKDHCIAHRTDQARFADSMAAIATPMDAKASEPYAMGEMGRGWRVHGGDAVFFLTPLGRCRMFILSERMDGVPAAFQRMAKQPPQGIGSRAFQVDGRVLPGVFIWTATDTSRQPMRIEASIGKQSGLDPADAHWILTAEPDIPAPAPVIWDMD